MLLAAQSWESAVTVTGSLASSSLDRLAPAQRSEGAVVGGWQCWLTGCTVLLDGADRSLHSGTVGFRSGPVQSEAEAAVRNA